MFKLKQNKKKSRYFSIARRMCGCGVNKRRNNKPPSRTASGVDLSCERTLRAGMSRNKTSNSCNICEYCVYCQQGFYLALKIRKTRMRRPPACYRVGLRARTSKIKKKKPRTHCRRRRSSGQQLRADIRHLPGPAPRLFYSFVLKRSTRAR